MDVHTIATEGLGDRSYVVSDGTVAVVIDPQRDIDRVLAVVDRAGARVAAVLETHLHNDYVTGGLALARRTGARYVLHEGDGVSFDRTAAADGWTLEVGDLEVRALATPGHTFTHLSYLIEGGRGPAAVFTGGSMLYGTVGRTDLLGAAAAEKLSRAQFRSVRGLAERLDGVVQVFPTHGFGSFCSSAGGGGREHGTIATERTDNIALQTDDEDLFVKSLLAGLTAHPPYYAHMAHLNRAGPFAPDLSPPRRAEPADLAARAAAGEWVVDLRDRRQFAADHLRGSVNVEGSGSLATYLGWALPWGTPVSLVGDSPAQITAAQRELVRIGIDRPQACAVGGVAAFAAGQERGTYRVATFADLADAGSPTVLDVRRPDEWEAGHLPGALHVPLEEVAAARDTLPRRPLWVHCATGYRASIAASLLAGAGHEVVLVDDDWERAHG